MLYLVKSYLVGMLTLLTFGLKVVEVVRAIMGVVRGLTKTKGAIGLQQVEALVI